MPTTNSLSFDDYDVSAHLSVVHKTMVLCCVEFRWCRYVVQICFIYFSLISVWCSFAAATRQLTAATWCARGRRIQRTYQVSLFFIVGFSSRAMSLAGLFAVSFFIFARLRVPNSCHSNWIVLVALALTEIVDFCMRSIIPLDGFNSIYNDIFAVFRFGSLIRAIITTNNWVWVLIYCNDGTDLQNECQMVNDQNSFKIPFVHSFVRSVHWIVIQISYLRFWLIHYL